LFDQHLSGGSGTQHSCGLKADGETWCWGYDSAGNLGVGTTDPTYTPTAISTYKFKQISTGEDHTCGYTIDDKLMCWGGNYQGQLGTGDYSSQTTPVEVDPLP